MRVNGCKVVLVGVAVALSAAPCVAQHLGDVLLDAEDRRLTIVSRINRGDARESRGRLEEGPPTTSPE